MKNSIEEIWKTGFLNEKSLVAPKINDLYNQKSKNLVNRIERLYRLNLILIVAMAIGFPIWYYFMGIIWQGVAISVLLFFTGWYSLRQKRGFTTLDHGANSLDYLKSFDLWLKNALLRGEKVLRFTYPLYFLIAISTILGEWNKHAEVVQRIRYEYPDLVFIGTVPLFAVVIVAAATLLMLYFSGRIYRFDVRLMYGRVFDKLRETIAEMERLKEE